MRRRCDVVGMISFIVVRLGEYKISRGLKLWKDVKIDREEVQWQALVKYHRYLSNQVVYLSAYLTDSGVSAIAVIP